MYSNFIVPDMANSPNGFRITIQYERRSCIISLVTSGNILSKMPRNGKDFLIGTGVNRFLLFHFVKPIVRQIPAYEAFAIEIACTVQEREEVVKYRNGN